MGKDNYTMILYAADQQENNLTCAIIRDTSIHNLYYSDSLSFSPQFTQGQPFNLTRNGASIFQIVIAPTL